MLLQITRFLNVIFTLSNKKCRGYLLRQKWSFFSHRSCPLEGWERNVEICGFWQNPQILMQILQILWIMQILWNENWLSVLLVSSQNLWNPQNPHSYICKIQSKSAKTASKSIKSTSKSTKSMDFAEICRFYRFCNHEV